VHEGFVWSAVYDAPVVFFLPEQPMGHLRATGAADPGAAVPARTGLRLPGIRVDGNDVLATLAVTRWALEECRTGTARC